MYWAFGSYFVLHRSFRAECERRGLKCVEQLLEEVAESQLLESVSTWKGCGFRKVVMVYNMYSPKWQAN